MKPLTLVSVEAKPRLGYYMKFVVTFDTEAGPIAKTLYWGGLAERLAKHDRRVEIKYQCVKICRDAYRQAYGADYRFKDLDLIEQAKSVFDCIPA